MLCLFEDHTVENFYPLSLTRHLSDLLVGTRTLGERATGLLGPGGVILHGRSYVREYCRAANRSLDFTDGPVLFVNAALLVDGDFPAKQPDGDRWLLGAGDRVVAARLTAEDVQYLNLDADALDFSLVPDLPCHDIEDVVLYSWLWDLIADNPGRIAADFVPLPPAVNQNAPGVHIVEPEMTAIAPDVVLKPGVVIDASAGPVIIERGTEVMANSVIEGPCYIGPNCRIKIGAKIYEGSSFGPWCKVGGEVENSILIGYANKQHDGFLGHSYIGSWVNLGADTNTSDLKNNYGPVRVTLNGRAVDTGMTFLGTLAGDHSKTGINTMLNTGTVMGVSANVFGGGFPPKEILSFSWGGADGFQVFNEQKALELAGRVMARRNVAYTDADARLLRHIFQQYHLRPDQD